MRFDPEDDEPAPFEKIKQQRALFRPQFTGGKPRAAASCTGKKPFITAHEATRSLRFMSNIAGRRIYRCHFCHQYHIGSSKL